MRDNKPTAAGQIAQAVQEKYKTNSGQLPSVVSPRSGLARLKKGALPEHWTAALFARLQGRYTHKWSSGIEDIEDVAVREWSNDLAGLTPEQIQHGLDTWDEDWPPSAPEFRKRALGEDDAVHRSAAYRFFPPALPRPKAKASIVEEQLAKMRKKPKLTPEQMDAERAKLRSTT